MRRMLLGAVFVCTLAIFAIISVAAVSVAMAEVLNHAHDWGPGWQTVTLADGRTYLERHCHLDNCDATETK